MTAKELLSQSIIPVQTSDTGEEVLQMMKVYHVSHLPIVNNEELLGVISEEDILIHNAEEPIGSYRLSYHRPYCLESDHLFEVMTKMGQLQLTVIPIVNADSVYLGLITMESLLQYLSTHFSFSEPGSIIVIETTKNNYSLSEIARIAESEDITILSSFVSTVPDSPKLYLTLKINRIESIVFKASLERFGYDIHASFSESDIQDTLKERYDSLIAYLNV